MMDFSYVVLNWVLICSEFLGDYLLIYSECLKHNEFGSELGQRLENNSHKRKMVHRSGDWPIVMSLQAEIIITGV